MTNFLAPPCSFSNGQPAPARGGSERNRPRKLERIEWELNPGFSGPVRSYGSRMWKAETRTLLGVRAVQSVGPLERSGR
jgi:hypothetical protein